MLRKTTDVVEKQIPRVTTKNLTAVLKAWTRSYFVTCVVVLAYAEGQTALSWILTHPLFNPSYLLPTTFILRAIVLPSSLLFQYTKTATRIAGCVSRAHYSTQGVTCATAIILHAQTARPGVGGIPPRRASTVRFKFQQLQSGSTVVHASQRLPFSKPFPRLPFLSQGIFSSPPPFRGERERLQLRRRDVLLSFVLVTICEYFWSVVNFLFMWVTLPFHFSRLSSEHFWVFFF